jgi:hypothetical protein
MWRRFLIVELVLTAGLIYGGLQLRQSWWAFDASHQVQSIAPEKEPARTLPQVNKLAGKVEDWTEISVKDPFSFDRNDVAIVAPKQAVPAQPKPLLFGTMSIGNEWIAMLAPAQGTNRSSQPVKIGQSIGDYWQLVEIHENSVVVASDNGVRQTVILNDPAAQVPRSYERTVTGSAPPPTLTPVANPGIAPSPQQTVATPSAPPQVPAAGGEQPKPRILNTPFGPIIRTDPQ